MTFMEIAAQREIYQKLVFILYCILICIVASLLYYPYFNWLSEQWKNDPYDTFGYFAPLVSCWIIYTQKKEILSKKVTHTKWGWFYFGGGVTLALLYWWNRQPVVASLSLPIILYGLVMVMWGKERSRSLMFPFFFLIFLYPWGDILDTIAGFQLRLFSVNAAFLLFKYMGMEDAAISGTLLFTGRFLIDIAPACSGLTIMNVLLFMGAIGAYLYNGSNTKGLVIFLSVIPLSIFLNTIRIIITGLAGHYWGEETAFNFFHNISGMLVFGLALLFLYFEASLFTWMDRTK
jgi:exosortase